MWATLARVKKEKSEDEAKNVASAAIPFQNNLEVGEKDGSGKGEKEGESGVYDNDPAHHNHGKSNTISW